MNFQCLVCYKGNKGNFVSTSIREGGEMIDNYDSHNMKDSEGNPTGGTVFGTGLSIDWQQGPLGTGAERKRPNGAFVETVISACVQRLEFYQDSKFKCDENADAIYALERALEVLNRRTDRRKAKGVEGTHEV